MLLTVFLLRGIFFLETFRESIMNGKLSLDWLAFTYKPNMASQRVIMAETLQNARHKLPIDYFFSDFPLIRDHVNAHGRELGHGRFNYNMGYLVGHNGKTNGSNDFMILACMVTDTAGVEYAFNQGVNVSVPGHYIPLFAELCGFSNVDEHNICDFLRFLKNKGCQGSRIDIAYDDFEKKFTPLFYAKEMLEGNIISKFNKWSYTTSTRTRGGDTFYLGDRKKRMLRIYDKEYESGGEIPSIRYEIESHELYAKELFNELCKVGLEFNFAEFFKQFITVSELSSSYDIWSSYFADHVFSEKLTLPRFNPYVQYLVNAKFKDTVYNFVATEAEFFGDAYILEQVHKARDNPTRRNKKLNSLYESIDLNHKRGEFIYKQFNSLGVNFER